jgi:hypothetical protein
VTTVVPRHLFVGVVTGALALGLGGCGVSSTTPSTVPSTSVSTAPAPLPSAAEQAATLKAKNAYRRLVIHAAEGFSEATAALDAALKRGDHLAAVKEWSLAQASFDTLRPALLGGPAASASYDGLVSDFGPGEQPVGLHEVERGLFTGRDQLARAAAPALAAAGPAVVIGLYRTIVQPSGVATKQVEQLGFLLDHVIAHHQEQFSHLDRIDLGAIASSVRDGFSALEDLARLVDPGLSRTTDADLRLLETAVRAIPTSATNDQIAPATWRYLSEVAVRLQVEFGQLGGEMSGYTSGRSYA